MRFTHALVPFIALLAAHLVVGCSDDTQDCHTLSMCPEGGSSTAGSGGNMSEAGAETGGSSSGKAGTAGAAGKGGTSGGSNTVGGAGTAGEGDSEAGAGGTPIVLPCDGACTGNKPVCKVSTDVCVECLMPSDCTSGVKTKCDTVSNSCVQCLAPTDCSDAEAAKCDNGACTKCTTNDDCAHLAGKTVCDAKAGECVQCTGTDYTSCGTDNGTPLVCDSLKRTCTTSKEHDAVECDACVSDANCKAGELCVLQRYSDKDVGYFCFWKQGDTANGAPADCFTTGHPYSQAIANATSVDRAKADICGLATSTCVAVSQIKTKDCKPGASPDNGLCGFDPPNDAKCDQVGVSTNYRCTMTCIGDEDCPGVTKCKGFVCDI